MIDILTIFLLGLGVIVHPCTAAPNLATMAFLKEKGQGRKVVWMYILGHTLAYIALGLLVAVLLRMGIASTGLEATIKEWGQPLLVGMFLVAGVWLIISSFHNHEHHHNHTRLFTGKGGAFASGVFVALSFCPEAALAFFEVLIPLTLTSEAGLALPFVFAIATALPLIMAEWLMHKGAMERLLHIKTMTRWFNLVIGILFIIAALIIYFL